jgi:hypothetical protein
MVFADTKAKPYGSMNNLQQMISILGQAMDSSVAYSGD